MEKTELKETKILNSIMKRHGSLLTLKSALNEDEDTVIFNLSNDMNDEVEEEDILKYIIKILG